MGTECLNTRFILPYSRMKRGVNDLQREAKDWVRSPFVVTKAHNRVTIKYCCIPRRPLFTDYRHTFTQKWI